METHIDRLECTQAEFHVAFNDRMEDIEEMTQSFKDSMDGMEGSVANTHSQLKTLEG
jgi:archaellum component FlaC